jgi:hypothetical protein
MDNLSSIIGRKWDDGIMGFDEMISHYTRYSIIPIVQYSATEAAIPDKSP